MSTLHYTKLEHGAHKMARMPLRGHNMQPYLVLIMLSAILSVAAGGISEKHFEQQGTVFSPEGRLYQVLSCRS